MDCREKDVDRTAIQLSDCHHLVSWNATSSLLPRREQRFGKIQCASDQPQAEMTRRPDVPELSSYAPIDELTFQIWHCVFRYLSSTRYSGRSRTDVPG